MNKPSPEEIQALLEQAQNFPCVKGKGMPTKKYFLLEDDIHDDGSYSYLGREADSVPELLKFLYGVYDWAYLICKTESNKIVGYGTFYHTAWDGWDD